MMNFPIARLLPLALLASPALAQVPGQLQPVSSPPKHAGTYHLATGTWTRAGAAAGVAPDVWYNNTGAIAYFTTMPDDSQSRFRITDNGRVPSPSDGGIGCSYTVDQLFFAYCSNAGVSNLTLTIEFQDEHQPCSGPITAATGSVVVPGIPNASIGVLSCWLLTVDLTGTTNSFEVVADADGVFDNDPARDDFGYTLSFSGHGNDTSTGPILFGDPAVSPFGDGTDHFGYGPGPDGTGLGQQDMFWLDTGGVTYNGCTWFGGYPQGPWAGFYLRLSGSAALPGPEGCGTSGLYYCVPAGANSVSPSGASLNQAGGFGTSLATFDLLDVPNQPGLLYGGPTQIDLPFGCGRRCVGGLVQRGPVIVPTGNQALGVPFDMSLPTTTNVQFWYRDPANFAGCGAAWNLSNALGL